MLIRQNHVFAHDFRLSAGALLQLAAIAIALTTVGCSGSSRLADREPDRNPRVRDARPTPVLAEAVRIESRLRGTVSEWYGTPYQWGGTTRSGVDCSGFVQRVYRDALNLGLNRTTAQQVLQGKPVRQEDLQTGDLVFFRPKIKTRHVGVYLSNGDFAHASSSRGVMISNLRESYWRRAYWTARRILPNLFAAFDDPGITIPHNHRVEKEPQTSSVRPTRIRW